MNYVVVSGSPQLFTSFYGGPWVIVVPVLINELCERAPNLRSIGLHYCTQKLYALFINPESVFSEEVIYVQIQSDL